MEIGSKTLEGSDSSPLLPVSNNLKSNQVSQCIHSYHISNSNISNSNIFNVFLVILTLGTLLSLPCLLISMSLVPQMPNFQLESLFVSKFNFSNKTFGVDWDITLKIANPNMISSVRFNDMKGSILYNDNSLAMYYLEPFELGYKEHRIVRVRISKDRKQVVNGWVLDEMKRQRHETGAVRLNMKMFVWATYKKGWWGTENKVVMKPRCLDLRIGFLPKTGFGSWVNGGPMECSIYNTELIVDHIN